MIIMTSTAGRTRLGAVATGLPVSALRVGTAAAVVAPHWAVRGAAVTAVPFGVSQRPRVYPAVIDGGLASAPKTSPENGAQLRASVRWSDDL